jgi:hypothetical protein
MTAIISMGVLSMGRMKAIGMKICLTMEGYVTTMEQAVGTQQYAKYHHHHHHSLQSAICLVTQSTLPIGGLLALQ